jgi:2-aminoadipate transaminase
MLIRIDRGSEVPVYRQIIQSVRSQILQGILPVGFRLPTERALARTLGVNRTTIMSAYAELKSEGLIRARVGDGTRVAAGGNAPEPPRAVLPLRWSDFTRLSFRPTDDEIKRLLALSEAQGVVVLSVGFPALDLIPLKLLKTATDAVMTKRGASAFFYGPAEGVSTFRESLAELMNVRGAPIAPDQILVTSGAQQALDLVARMLVDPGDTVVIEEPTYLGALQVLRAARARIVSVPVDSEGMRTDLLENILERSSPKLIYTLPTFQNPSGAVMSNERRMKLLDLAYRFRVPILEDDTYGDLWFDEPPPQPLRALDRHEYVLYASSFSKTLSPGLRVGWIAGPRPLIRRLVQVKQTVDLQAPTLSQMIVDEIVRSGKYAKHVADGRVAYAERGRAMGESLKKRARGWAEWIPPRGGFYYWCRIKTPVPVSALAAEAAAMRVSILPGAACMADEPTESYVRLSFSYPKPEEIDEGIARLARVVRRVAAQQEQVGLAVEATRPAV